MTCPFKSWTLFLETVFRRFISYSWTSMIYNIARVECCLIYNLSLIYSLHILSICYILLSMHYSLYIQISYITFSYNLYIFLIFVSSIFAGITMSQFNRKIKLIEIACMTKPCVKLEIVTVSSTKKYHNRSDSTGITYPWSSSPTYCIICINVHNVHTNKHI